MKRDPPIALTIAGSDSSAGAGIQADLKTFSRFGVYGLTAVTCVVAEVPGKVSGIFPLAPEQVREQLALSFRHFPVAAVKTGMLCSARIVDAVCGFLEKIPAKQRPQIVVDPVMVASSGDCLLEPSAIKQYTERLFPLAAVITPNLDEAAVLLNRPVRNDAEMRKAALELEQCFRKPILLKGGHLKRKVAVDLLSQQGRMLRLSARFIPGISTHGTGCAYSAAIAANLASGKDLIASCRSAKRFVTRAIGQSLRWKGPAGTVSALRH